MRSLKGREGIRLRVGDWRVIMDDQGNVLAVPDVGPRGHVHDGKGTGMNEMVTVPREEHDRLRAAAEDLAYLRSCDRAKAALAGGADELIPADYANRLRDGEIPLRIYRHLRGLTQAMPAEKAAVNRHQSEHACHGRLSVLVNSGKFPLL